MAVARFCTVRRQFTWGLLPVTTTNWPELGTPGAMAVYVRPAMVRVSPAVRPVLATVESRVMASRWGYVRSQPQRQPFHSATSYMCGGCELLCWMPGPPTPSSPKSLALV